MNRVVDFILDLVYPKYCEKCRKVIDFTRPYCDCENGTNVIRVSENFCHHCGMQTSQCSCTVPSSAYLPHITAPFVYTELVKSDIHDFKFFHKLKLKKPFGYEMAQRILTSYKGVKFDYITFVPMSRESLVERGYNQSQLLCREVSKRLQIPMKNLINKKVHTENQHDLNSAKRLKNLDNAFEFCGCDIKDKTILICDDIKSTGTTLKKCCDLLMQNGAKDVYAVCIAVSDFHKLEF